MSEAPRKPALPESSPPTLTAGPVAISDETLRTLFADITGKQSSLFRFFSKSVVVHFEDIKQLYIKLHQEISTHKIIAERFTSSLSLSNEQDVELKTWDEFAAFDSSQAEHITEISLRFDYLIRHTRSDGPERYTVEVSIRSNVYSIERYIFSHIGDSRGIPTVRAKVQYIDYIVGKNIFHTVERWVESLEEAPSRWHYPLVQKYSDLIRMMLPRTGSIFAVFFAWGLAKYMDVSSFDMNAVNWIIISLTVYSITYAIIFTSCTKAEQSIRMTARTSFILFTRGDNKLYKNRLKDNKNLLFSSLKWISGAVGAIIVNIASGLIMQYWS